MPQPLPRAFRSQQQAEDERKLEKILSQTAKLEASSTAGATAAGDKARLRGIPAVGRGTSGAVRGSDPARALLSKQR